jgi:hypothetical protein
MNIHRSLRSAIAALFIAFIIPIGSSYSYGMRDKPISKGTTIRGKAKPGHNRKWPNFKTRSYPVVVNEKKMLKSESAEFSKKKNYLREHQRVVKKNNRGPEG